MLIRESGPKSKLHGNDYRIGSDEFKPTQATSLIGIGPRGPGKNEIQARPRKNKATDRFECTEKTKVRP